MPVQKLVGRELTHIGLGMYEIHLDFGRGAHLAILDGGWHLKDRDGNVVDQDIDPPSTRKSFQLHRLLMQPVTGASIDAPRSFTITFANGDALTIYDNSSQFESFSLRVDVYEFYI